MSCSNISKEGFHSFIEEKVDIEDLVLTSQADQAIADQVVDIKEEKLDDTEIHQNCALGHEENKLQMKCVICDLNFGCKKELNIHFRSIHDGKNPTKSYVKLQDVRLSLFDDLIKSRNQNALLKEKLVKMTKENEELINLNSIHEKSFQELTDQFNLSVKTVQKLEIEKNKNIADFTQIEGERDELIIDFTKTKQELKKAVAENGRLNSQFQKFKDGMSSVLFSVTDNDSNNQPIMFETSEVNLEEENNIQEHDAVTNDHLNSVKILEGNLLKLRKDHIDLINIPLRKNDKPVKSNEKKKNIDIIENAANFEQKKDIKKKREKCFKQSKIHVVQKQYMCQYCEKGFNKNSNLKRHEMIHTDEKPFSCCYCSYASSRLSHMKEHKMVHTKEKPYSCKICSKKFSQAGSLKKHEMIHNGEKPFQCQYCSKEFREKGKLKMHEMIHTGEKPFSCRYCPKKLRQKFHLKTHEHSCARKKAVEISEI